jgi:uncharacterized protein YbcI
MSSGGYTGATGGELNQAVAKLVVRAHNRYTGRGAPRAIAFYRRNVLVVVMQDALTKGERSLADDGMGESVLQMRHEVQESLRDELVAGVEQLTGCKVTAFMSDNHIDPDVAAELFVLDRSVPSPPPAAAPTSSG